MLKPAFFSMLLGLCFLTACTNNSNTPNTDTKTDTTATQPVTTTKPDPSPSNSTQQPQGIDISKYQGTEVDVLDAAKDQLSFIICKATEGDTYVDPEFANNWKTVAEKGMIRGTYHFYHTADDPVKQAKHYVATVGNWEASDLPPIVDFEGGGIDKSQSVETIKAGLKKFLETVVAETGRWPIIYTNIPTANDYLKDAGFEAHPLWLALYEDVKEPRLPDAWKDASWLFWQKNSSYKLDGKNNDFDVFNGTEESLKDYIKNSVPPVAATATEG